MPVAVADPGSLTRPARADFVGFPKITRLSNITVTVTEKIDGTNACLVFDQDGSLTTQSRRRVITPDDDNFGFATWAHANSSLLFRVFGPGRHFGEWWGLGIQRGYNADRRFFSPFNVSRFTAEVLDEARIHLNLSLVAVPVLHVGPLDDVLLDVYSDCQPWFQSHLDPTGRTPAEGVMLYLSNGVYIKSPFDPNPKGHADE